MPVIARAAQHLQDNLVDTTLAEYGTTANESNSVAWICRSELFPDDQNEADSVRKFIRQALLNSGYPLRSVDCWCDEEKLVLYGRVTRYYYAQVALETALPLSNGRKIETRIDVVRKSASIDG